MADFLASGLPRFFYHVETGSVCLAGYFTENEFF